MKNKLIKIEDLEGLDIEVKEGNRIVQSKEKIVNLLNGAYKHPLINIEIFHIETKDENGEIDSFNSSTNFVEKLNKSQLSNLLNYCFLEVKEGSINVCTISGKLDDKTSRKVDIKIKKE